MYLSWTEHSATVQQPHALGDHPKIKFPLASPQSHRQQQRGGHSGHPVSARQNKKQRKGRGNVHQRERTVTTLTQDPNTHYLVPTPSEDPAGASLSFNNPKMQNIQKGSSFGSYQYGPSSPFNMMHPNVQQQRQSFLGSSQQQTLPQQPLPHSQPQPMKPTLPPGKSDLDILQNLKQIIKDGQHPFFRAVPQPAALASIYMGTIPSQYQAQERLGETPGDSAEQSVVETNGVSGPAANDTGRRQPSHVDDGHGLDYIPLDRAPSDSQPNPVDSRPQPDSRDMPASSQGPSIDSRSEAVNAVGPPSNASDPIVPPQSQARPPAAPADADDIQSSRSSSLRPTTDAANLGSVPSPSDGGGRPDIPLEDNGPRPSLKDRLVPSLTAGRASSEHPSYYGDHPNLHSRRARFGTSPSNGTPMPDSGGQGPPRSFHPSLPEGRGGKSLSSPPHRHPPLGRPMGREDRGNYRAEYDPRRADALDDTLARYGDRFYRDFSPPLMEIPRGGGDRAGRPAPFPPSPGRAPPGGDISSRRGEWQYQQYPPSPGVPQDWEVDERWDRTGDRDRFERDVPPRGAGWDYRGDREFITRDGYSSAPPLDDRGYGPSLPNRDADRGRPLGPYTPPYGRVRPRSPSPIRRAGSGPMDDSRLVMKRPREDFPPSGYYPHVPPAGDRDGPGPMSRPPGAYPPPPPRSANSGPPPGSSSWPPPPASGPSSIGPAGDRDRDYRMGRDGMDFPPPSTGYDRPRTPPGPLGRQSYFRGGGGGYGRGDPRDRGGYGRP